MRREAVSADPEIRRWWRQLTLGERVDVQRWLADVPPPENWRGTRIEWAHTECSSGLITGRYGRLL